MSIIEENQNINQYIIINPHIIRFPIIDHTKTDPNYDSLEGSEISQISQYKSFDSNIILSNIVNELTNLIGKSLVLTGFYTTYYNFDGINLEIHLCGGVFIQDNCIIQVYDPIKLIIDTTKYDINNGYFIIHPNYSYLDKSYNNNVKICLQYICDKTNMVFPYGWSESRDSMYFDIFRYNQSLNVFEIYDKPSINIQNHIFHYRGYVNDNMKKINYTFNKHYQDFNIKNISVLDMGPPITFGNIREDLHNKLISMNGNLININDNSNDVRYYGHDILLNDEINNKNYNIYSYDGNLILKETLNNTNKLKKSKMKDFGLVNTYNRNIYNVKVEYGNIILEEDDLILNTTCS